MKTFQDACLAVALSALFLSLPGCFGTSDQPDLGQVKGTITLDGQPLKGIEVVFYPDGGRPARSRTNAEGKYELKYIRDTLGTKVGHNRVEIAPNEEGEESYEEEIEVEDVDAAPAKPLLKAKKPVIPARYNTKSELEADVKPGENTFDFDLKS